MKLLIIDTFYFLHRSFHAFPNEMRNSEGDRTNVLFGFTQSFLNAVLQFKPTHVVCAWETEDQPSFRKTLYPQYQIHRKSGDTEEEMIFKDQIPKVAELLKTFNIPRIFENGFEGDDIIGTIARKAKEINNSEVIIYTADKDMLQLVDDQVTVFRPSSPPFVKSKLVDKSSFIEEYEFNPEYMIDYKALRGDPSDNIPGVMGIGDKTARILIKEYKTIENIYNNIDNIDKTAVRNKLIKDKENAFLSKQLATIITNIPIEFDMNKARLEEFNIDAVVSLFEYFEFKSLFGNLDALRNLQMENMPDVSSLFE